MTPPQVSHDILRHPAIYYSQIRRHRRHGARGTERKRYRKKRRCRNNHRTQPHIQPSTIGNHFCCVILFATKWGLNFHGLYHIVLCCTRLQSEASGRGQSEREGIYIYLVCGLMAPYVCEEMWQGEVGSERRPTPPPPLPLCSLTSPSSRHMPQTAPPSTSAVLPRLTGAVLSVSTHRADVSKHLSPRGYHSYCSRLTKVLMAGER